MAAQDPQGIVYPTATPRDMEIYDRLIRQMSFFQAPVVETLEEAIAANPAFAMPYVARAYLMLYMTEPGYNAIAAQTMDALRAAVPLSALSEVERTHIAAIDAWVGGDLRRAAAILDRLGLDHPREIMALRVGHEIDFFAGNTRNLRDRVARQIGAWGDDDPHYGIVLGALAFGLEENGQYDAAEATGLQALVLNPQDAWAIHAVAHAQEMRGQTGQGIRFLSDRQADWGPGNLFAPHNWWHLALFQLDGGDPSAALATYDRGILPPDQMRAAMPLTDAAALLWRMHVDGLDVSDRARPLSADWKGLLTGPPLYPFNDMHAVMAHVAAGDQPAAEAVVARIAAWLERGDDGSAAWAMSHRVGLPVCRAIADFGAGRYADCARALFGLRAIAHEFGGSHAQRDVLDRTLLAAALRGGDGAMARALASERATVTARNPSNWRKLAQALTLSGAAPDRIEAARRQAETLTATAHTEARTEARTAARTEAAPA